MSLLARNEKVNRPYPALEACVVYKDQFEGHHPAPCRARSGKLSNCVQYLVMLKHCFPLGRQ